MSALSLQASNAATTLPWPCFQIAMMSDDDNRISLVDDFDCDTPTPLMTEALRCNSRSDARRHKWPMSNVNPKARGQLLFVATAAAKSW
jgi:hypothetical protein